MTEFVQELRAIHRPSEDPCFAVQGSPPHQGHATLHASLAGLTAAVSALTLDKKELQSHLLHPRLLCSRLCLTNFHVNLALSNVTDTLGSCDSESIAFAHSCPYDQQCQLCFGWAHNQLQCANNQQSERNIAANHPDGQPDIYTLAGLHGETPVTPNVEPASPPPVADTSLNGDIEEMTDSVSCLFVQSSVRGSVPATTVLVCVYQVEVKL
eukprot:gene13652-15080_t